VKRIARLIRVGLLLASTAAAHGDPAVPQRIVSLNLCTDQLVLELVERPRIAMLSQLATDPLLSWRAAEARGVARFDGSVEAVMGLAPDLVLAGSLASVSTVAVLQRLGYRVETLAMPESIADSLRFIVEVGKLLGEEAAARELRDRTAARLAHVKERAAALAGAPLALIYLPNGLSPGAGTLKDELLRLAGFRNLTAEQGIRDYGTIGLETLLAHRPALVVLDAVDLEHTSLAQHLLDHPALTAGHTIPTARMPTPLWICGGPQIAEAVETILAMRTGEQADKPVRNGFPH